MQSKYSNRFYWEKKVKEQKQLNLFSTKKITKDTVFFHGVILDQYGVQYDEWLALPSVDATLGFLTYLFIPISFYSLSSKEGKICIPVDGYLVELIDEIQESDRFDSVLNEKSMYEVSERLNKIWDGTIDQAKEELSKLQRYYLQAFNQTMKTFTYFKLFYSARELGEYIVKSYEEDPILHIEDLERNLGMTKEQWLELCDQVYDNEFVCRRFTEILTNRLSQLI